MVARFDGGLLHLQWSSVVLAVVRRYNGSSRCWRRPALPGVTRIVGGVPLYMGGIPPLQRSYTLLAVSRLYGGRPR